MRILVDSNVLFSAVLFPGSKPAQALLYAVDNHKIVLCDRNIEELREDSEALQNGERRSVGDAQILHVI